MDTNKMLDQFESFARDVMCWDDDEFRLALDGKSYYWASTGDAWVFWQASRESVEMHMPRRYTIDSFDGIVDSEEGHLVYAADVEAAIEVQGLRVKS
ncbi:hypothetical protein [Pseudomonas sp. Hg5Tf]|uniref:Uncharacterized protein n=1 Tax=Pseudomonas sp. Hg7Tf TaxID=3236988 RepID=A0AB39HWY2_9PSED|nr:hypothetical protein [Pseudomonas sp. Hg5Tf]MDH2559018.1 hypothetical protein [Pseudomonas sp. Hg5Tf]